MSPTAFALGIGFDMVGLGGNPVVGHATPGNYAPVGGVSAFTRADASTCATYKDVNAVAQTVAANILRDSHHAPNGTRVILLESTRKNLVLQASNYSATWTLTDTTVTANAIAAPDGTTTAQLLTAGVAGTDGVSQTVTGTANASYALTFFLEKGNQNWVFIRFGDATNQIHGWVNVGSGTAGSALNAGTATGATLSVEAWGNWLRCTLTGKVNNGTTAIGINAFCVTADQSTTRIHSSTRYQWGYQFEDNIAFPTTLIQTTTAAVTRAVDALTLGGVAGTGPATLFYRYWDLATAAWINIAAAYTFGTTIIPPVDRAYSDIVVFKGTLTTAQCQAALGF